MELFLLLLLIIVIIFLIVLEKIKEKKESEKRAREIQEKIKFENYLQEQKKKAEEERAKEEEKYPYEHKIYYLRETKNTNSDGEKRQDLIYQYKTQRPPFDEGVDVTMRSDDSAPEIVEVLLNDCVIGQFSKDTALYLSENWSRIDRITAVEVEGRRGAYDVKVYVRFYKPGKEPNSK